MLKDEDPISQYKIQVGGLPHGSMLGSELIGAERAYDPYGEGCGEDSRGSAERIDAPAEVAPDGYGSERRW